MYEQKRTEVNKAAEKYEKAMKAAKRSGNKANQVPHRGPNASGLLPMLGR